MMIPNELMLVRMWKSVSQIDHKCKNSAWNIVHKSLTKHTVTVWISEIMSDNRTNIFLLHILCIKN
jgi:hypothetical protein